MKVNPTKHECLLSEIDQIFRDSYSWMKEGKVVDGRIKNITSYGAFVSIKSEDGLEHGIHGLVHKSEISWRQCDVPEDVLTEGDMQLVLEYNIQIQPVLVDLAIYGSKNLCFLSSSSRGPLSTFLQFDIRKLFLEAAV